MIRSILAATLLLLISPGGKAAQVSYFTIDSVLGAQISGAPFNLAVTARDTTGAAVVDFSGTVSLQAIPEPLASTESMLGNISSSGASGAATVGFAFTPTSDIVVTHVRHISGGRISLWTDDGVLLASRDVLDCGQWLETPLLLPLRLQSGQTYRLTLYSSNTRYTSTAITSFPHGLIGPNYYANSDTFPSEVVPQTYLVDLRYFVGNSDAVPISPNATSAFTNGAWVGSVRVSQPTQGIRIFVTDGFGHSGTGRVFSVLGANDIAVSIGQTNSPVLVGEPFVYTAVITNTGPSSAIVSLSNWYLGPIGSVIASASQGNCTVNSNGVSCHFGTVPGGASANVVMTLTATNSGVVSLHARAKRGEIDGSYVNNEAAALNVIKPRPLVFISDVLIVEGGTGMTNCQVQLSLSYPSSQLILVPFATSNGTARAGGDYLSSLGTAVFHPGTTNASASLSVIGDTISESNEFYFVVLATPTNAVLARSRATVTINDDDPLPSVSIQDAVVSEGNSATTNAIFKVLLSAPSERRITVRYATANGTAVSGSDYQPRPGTTLIFDPGVTNQNVSVAVNGDVFSEDNESFAVTLSNPVNVVILKTNAVGTILNDDPLTVMVDDTMIVEGDAGYTNALFTVRLSSPTNQMVSVDFAITNGTATAGLDYIATNGTLHFPPGVTTQSVSVTVLVDLLHEATETFFLNLSNATVAFIADGQGICSINNDDPRPVLSISDIAVFEGDEGVTNAVFAIILSAVSGQNVQVNYATVNDTAVQPADYLRIATTTMTFLPGSTTQFVTVQILGDMADELDETFLLRLSSPVNASIGKADGLGTILTDEGGAGQLHHFHWTSVPATILQGSNFPVTLTAQDRFNLTLSNFAGPINLLGALAPGFVPSSSFVAPTTTGLFTNGVWNGDMAFLQAARNAVMIATNGGKAGGVSNPFEVAGANDVRLSMQTSQTLAYPNDPVTWTIAVTNPGPSAVGVVVSNLLPLGVTFGSAVPSQGSCVVNGGQVMCNLGVIGAASTASITITATGAVPGVITNRATTLVSGSDPDLSNNVASTTNRILAPLHHFAFDTLSSTQQADVLMPITIRAKDFDNNTVSNWNGSVQLSASTSFREDFEDGNLNGWSGRSQVTNRIGGVLGDYAVNLMGTDGISHSLPNLRPEQLKFRARMMSQTGNPFQDNAFCTISSGDAENQRVLHFQMRGGNLTVITPGGNYSTPYQTNLWYEVVFTFNWVGRTVNYSVNGASIATGVPFYGTNSTSLTTIDVYNFFASDSWWDDIQFIGSGNTYSVGTEPSSLSSFSNGVWNGHILLQSSGTNLQLAVTNAAGYSGISQTFNVGPGPRGLVHQFEWDVVAATQTVAAPFAATVRAKDVLGNTISNYAGAVAFQAVADGPLRVLAFVRYAGLEGDDVGTFAALSRFFTNYTLVTTTNEDPLVLDQELAGTDVFLIPGQLNAQVGQMYSFGFVWGSVITNFVRRGGWLVVGTALRGELELFHSSGLFQQGPWNYGGGAGTILSPVPSHYLAQGVLAPFDFSQGLLTFLSTTGGTDAIPNVISSREVGMGRALFYGTRFNIPGTPADLMLANAFRRKEAERVRSVSFSPTNSSSFSNGIWTGTFVFHKPADSLRLVAMGQAEHFGASQAFSVLITNDVGLTMVMTNLVQISNTLSCRIIVTNTGPFIASGVQVTNLIPLSTTLLECVVSQGTCSTSNGKLICDLGSLSNGFSAVIDFTLIPFTSGLITNIAFVSRNEPDFFAGNNSASAVAQVLVPPTLSISSNAIAEGNSGMTALQFEVTIMPPSTQSVSVIYGTVPGSALAGIDFASTNGLLTIPPGATNGFITVSLIGDTICESNEMFQVQLSLATNAFIGVGTATGSIIDDGDPLPFLLIDYAEGMELDSGFGTAVVTLRLTMASGRETSVDYATADGTATAPADYIPASGTIVFPPGVTNQTVSVSLSSDTVNEPNEFFLLNLFNPINSTLVYPQTSVLIGNDDALPGKIDRLELSAAANPTAVGSPFILTVKAKDALGFAVGADSDSFNLTARQGRPSNRVEILSFTRFVDDSRYPTPLRAISNWFPNFHETNTTTIDPILLGALLQDKQVFLIPAQSYAPAGYMGLLGKGWSNILGQFVRRGGILIVLSDNYDEHLLLLNSGLLNLTRVGTVGEYPVIVGTQSQLSEEVPATFAGPVMSYYTASNNGVVGFRLLHAEDYPVVIHRQIDLGAVFMIGAGFYSPGTAFDRILANAVKWNSGEGFLPVAFSANGPFVLTNGLWAGPVTILGVTTNCSFVAVDTKGHTGIGNQFNVLADTDGDGLPDTWELEFGLDPHNPIDALDDSDMDGATNLDEFRSGTTSTNASSALRAGDIRINGAVVSLRVQTVSGKRYQIESSTGLSTWQPIGDAFSGIGGELEVILDLPAPSSAYFFRVRLTD